MALIGVDIGSSFVKAAILDVEELTLKRTARAPFPDAITGLPAGHFEVNPLAVAAAVDLTIRELLAGPDEITGILFCSQMGGLVLADRRGDPRGNYLSWRDQRTVVRDSPEQGTPFDRLRQRLGDALFREIGQELKPGSMLCLLDWLHARQLLPADRVPLGLGEFVVQRLCVAPPVVEPTAALGTLNLTTGDWHRPLFAAAGLPDLPWPKIGTFQSAAGEFRCGSRTIPCYPAVGDHQAALAGSLLQSRELSVNVSTGSQVSQITQALQLADCQTRPYFDGRFLNTLTHLPAGRSLQVLIDLLTELARTSGLTIADPWKLAIDAADIADDNGPNVDLSFFAGPLGERGAITGISTENLTVGSLFRNAFRAMATNYALCARRVVPDRNWTRIVFSGGLVQKITQLRRMIADEIGGEFRVAPFAEDTLMGLLALALVVSGKAETVSQASELLSNSNH
jgi:sugar (pentulose or hexulose) kinase